MNKYIVLMVVLVLFALPAYAAEDVVDVHMYTVRYSSEGVVGYEQIISNKVGFKDFVTYYPFLYPDVESKSYTFDVGLLDNGELYGLKSVTFHDTPSNDPGSLTEDVDFVWMPSESGDHSLELVFDYSDKISEIREDNNVFSFSIYVFPTRLDRYMAFVRMNKFLLIFACLYLVFMVLYLVYKKRIFD